LSFLPEELELDAVYDALTQWILTVQELRLQWVLLFVSKTIYTHHFLHFFNLEICKKLCGSFSESALCRAYSGMLLLL